MTEELSDLIDDVVEASSAEQEQRLDQLMAQQEPSDVALLLESLPLSQRLELWPSVPFDERVAVLVAMRGDPRESLLDAMSLEQLDILFLGLNAESLIELSESLPTRLVERALAAMDEKQRKYFDSAQKYDNDLAGHWVDHQVLILPVNAKVRDACRLLRREVPAFSEILYLVNRSGHYLGAVFVNELFSSLDHEFLADIVDPEIPEILASEDAVSAASKLQFSQMVALPVVDDEQKFLGRINMQTAAEIINENYEAQMMARAGLDEDEDLFAPVIKSSRNRMVWLGINLLTAFLASWFIGLFEATLQQVVALAVLMPVVASMGGIAGSQTLTLIIRGLALGQVTRANLSALLKKEVSVGGLNGILWALVVGVIASLWFQSSMIGVVIALAIFANILAAAVSGVVIPVLLDKYQLDPALSGSVILTTVTDVVGFVAFLGLGSLFLLN